MIPDLQSCLLCDDVRQEMNGKFILIGLFDTIALPAFPAHYPRLCMVTRWCSGEGEFRQRSRILLPDQVKTVVEGKPIPFRLPTPEATATNVEIFMHTPIAAPGVYWVEVLLGDDLKLRFPLRVVQAPQPPRPGHPPPPAG